MPLGVRFERSRCFAKDWFSIDLISHFMGLGGRRRRLQNSAKENKKPSKLCCHWQALEGDTCLHWHCLCTRAFYAVFDPEKARKYFGVLNSPTRPRTGVVRTSLSANRGA